MTSREIFNKVKSALLLQRKKSFDEQTCDFFYHSPDGCKCAIGHLIPDYLYSTKLEGWPFTCFPKEVLDYIYPSDFDFEKSFEFLNRLRLIHDSFPVESWEPMFDNLEEQFLK